MFLNIFKTILIVSMLINNVFAQSITIKLPDGWTKNEELSQKGTKLVFSTQNKSKMPVETLTITVENIDAGANNLLWNNLIELQKTYDDFKFYKPEYTSENAIGLGCSVNGSFCIVQRIEKFGNEQYIYTYKNSYPHYSQGFIGKWVNICAQIRAGEQTKTDNYQEIFEI